MLQMFKRTGPLASTRRGNKKTKQRSGAKTRKVPETDLSSIDVEPENKGMVFPLLLLLLLL